MVELRPWLMSNVIYPVYHRLKGDGLMPAVDEYLKNQWLSSDELRELQLSKLQRLLSSSAEHVPYYRQLFDEYALDTDAEVDLSQFRRLPLLTKAVMRNEGRRLKSDAVAESFLVKNSTSGSTGEPLAFYNDKQSMMWRQAVIWRNQEWLGVRYSDREARLWGASMDINKAASIREKLSSWAHQTILLSTYDLSDEIMASYVQRLEVFKPRLLVSYPGPLVTFASFLEREKLSLPCIEAIVTSAEQLHDWQREVIERVFGQIVFDRYGSREFGNIAHECEAHSGYHLNSERFYVEILRPDGEPSAPGELGELVITDLDNFGFPFIRYQIGDMAVPSASVCTCGRGLEMVERFEGRSLDMVRCENGNRVGGTFWTILMRRYPGVSQFQVEQLALDHLVVRIKTDPTWQLSSEDSLLEDIREKCGERTRVTFEYVDAIDLTASGKQKLVISQLSTASADQ